MKLTISNQSAESIVKYISETRVHLASWAKIINCEIFDHPIAFESYSCCNRSKLEGYLGVGCFSYVCDAHIKKYVNIGARVSIGGMDHPTNWLSVGAFQYNDMTAVFGESISERNRCIFEQKKGTVQIESDCWIGDNSVVLRGVKLSIGTIVAAGSVVTKDTLPYSIVAGNPAKIIRYRFDDSTINRLLNSNWWDLDIEALDGIPFNNVSEALKHLK